MKKNIIIIVLLIIIISLVIFILINENKDNKNNLDNDINNITNDNNNYDDKDTYTEVDIINYTNTLDEAIDNDDSSIKDKLKDNFITIVDFIFYDKEIKGYKFSQLTNSAKLKVINTALKIDKKIDEYFPGYKESISDKYKQIKDKLVILYLDTTVSICSNNEEECQKAKELFSSVKDNISIGLNYIKDIAINGKNKLKDYYEIFRDS